MQDRTSPTPTTPHDQRRIFHIRLLTAAIQAALLYILLRTGSSEDAIKNAWQSLHPELHIPLLLAAVYAPIAILLGAGQMRRRPLIMWTVLVVLASAGLGYHDAMRSDVEPYELVSGLRVPSFRLWLMLAAAGFVGHVLMTDRFGVNIDATTDSHATSNIAPNIASTPAANPTAYVRHFNTAWRIGLQIALAFIFLGVFWLVLQLGATLFRTIGLPAPARIIKTLGFALPACTLAIATAIHVTSIQSSLIRGIRLLVLTLFSWLLPLMAAIVAAFLVSLIFQSVQPLWSTRYAASLLLSSTALMVFLINACYQDGSPGLEGQRLRRWAAMLGAVELLPLVGLAIWALQLRVRQYGWTVDRIVAAAVCVMAAWYAVGYATSLIRARGWMKRLEATNVSAAYLFLILVVALFTPVADPARLMVADQISRLKTGVTDPEKFDYSVLYLEGGRWGRDALQNLAADPGNTGNTGATSEANSNTSGATGLPGPAAAIIKARAQEALDARARSRDYVYREPDAALLAKNVDVLPAGRALPDVFLKKDIWSKNTWGLPTCSYGAQNRCTARFINLAPGAPEALLFIDDSARYLFQPDAQGNWQFLGDLDGGSNCGRVEDKIESADIQAVPAALPDIMVGEQRLRIIPRKNTCHSTTARDAQ